MIIEIHKSKAYGFTARYSEDKNSFLAVTINKNDCPHDIDNQLKAKTARELIRGLRERFILIKKIKVEKCWFYECDLDLGYIARKK